MTRYTCQPHTFKDGFTLPAGVLTAMPLSNRYRDPSIYPNPNVFKPDRFLHSTNRKNGFHQSVEEKEQALAFGAGIHRCPGMHLANAITKMVIAELLLNYELAYKDGKRPDPVIDVFHVTPDPKAEFLVRKRTEIEMEYDRGVCTPATAAVLEFIRNNRNDLI
jgi:cytochrome P450